jgi:hypothetical protein
VHQFLKELEISGLEKQLILNTSAQDGYEGLLSDITVKSPSVRFFTISCRLDEKSNFKDGVLE